VKVSVCRLCGRAHRSTDPHIFDDSVSSLDSPNVGQIDQVATRNRGRLLPKRQVAEPVRSIEPMADYVSRAEFDALRVTVDALRVTVAALRSNAPVTVRSPVVENPDGEASSTGSTNAERQRRYRQRLKEGTK